MNGSSKGGKTVDGDCNVGDLFGDHFLYQLGGARNISHFADHWLMIQVL